MQKVSQKILRIHGYILLLIGAVVFINAFVGYNFSLGRFQFLSTNPTAAVGFLEAYGLAGMIGLSLIFGSRVFHKKPWHFLGALVHLFLFTINIAFWELYEPLGLTVAGWIATLFHAAVFILQGLFFVGAILNERRLRQAQ